MNTTQTFPVNGNNGSANNNKGNNSNLGRAAAAAAAAGVAGGVAGYAAGRYAGGDDEEVIEDGEDIGATTTGATTNNGAAGTTSTTTGGQNAGSNTQTPPASTTTPPVEEPGETIDTPTPPVEGGDTPVNPEDITVEIDEVPEGVNPDEIAEAVISDEQYGDDIEAADVFNFDEIGEVYTVEGDSFTAAAFHDDSGNDYVMLDVNGDEVFDVIVDTEGNLVSDTAYDVTLADAQTSIDGEIDYLAASDVPETDIPDDSYMDDIINV